MSDGLLPHSEEAEKGVLSSFLHNPTAVGAVCAELNMSGEKFYLPARAQMFDALFTMWLNNEPIDLITTTQRLRDLKILDDVGGASELTSLQFFLPSAVNVRSYIHTVLGKYRLRKGLLLANEFSQKFRTDDDFPDDVVEEFCRRAAELPMNTRNAVRSTKELVLNAIERMNVAFETKGNNPNVQPTGFKQIDAAIGGGVRPSDFILVSAPTKGGKSIFAHNVCRYVSLTCKKPTLILSLEMPSDNVIDRIISDMAGVELVNMRNGWLRERDFPALTAATSQLAGAPLLVRDDLYSLVQVVAGVRQAKAAHPDLKLAVIDYAQLIDVPMRKGENREAVVAQISTTLRRLAIQLDMAIMVLSQENDDGRARESRRLEQDCTTWLQLVPSEDQSIMNAKIRLNRNGPPCETTLWFRGPYLRLENMREEEQQEQPDLIPPKRQSYPPKRARDKE